MSTLALLTTKILTLLVLAAAVVMIATRRDAWGGPLLLVFVAIVHGRRTMWRAVGGKAAVSPDGRATPPPRRAGRLG